MLSWQAIVTWITNRDRRVKRGDSWSHGPDQEHKTCTAPGESKWVDFGEAEGFAHCALSVSATPHEGADGGDTHVLKVDNVNITGVESTQGDLSFMTYFAGCNVTNNGQTTITNYSVLVGVIVP